MRRIHFDKKARYVSAFDTDTGFYIRSGILDINGKDTGVDPFMSSSPTLVDIGCVGHCTAGEEGLCKHGGIECYQSGGSIHQPHMLLSDFKRIIDETKETVDQVALGGRGDPDTHPDFEEMLAYCRVNNVVPNFTTSGLRMTPEKAAVCKTHCGAVAISWQRGPHTIAAIKMLIDSGVKTNIHYVLGNNSIGEAIGRLEGIYSDYQYDWPMGDKLNAVIFLLHKPVGCGSKKNVLDVRDPRVARLFELIGRIDTNRPYKIGLDSCCIPGIVNFAHDVSLDCVDTCEGGRWSMYVTPDMQALCCSFDQKGTTAVDLHTHTIQEAWDSSQFEAFRQKLAGACPTCNKRLACMGGCPLEPSVVLCNRFERR